MSKLDQCMNLLRAMGSTHLEVKHDSYGEKIIGTCPMHEDSNPSFMLRPESEVYSCFACGSGHELKTRDGRTYNPKTGLVNLYKKHIIETTGKQPHTREAVKFVSKYVDLDKKRKKIKQKFDKYDLAPLPESHLGAFFPATGHYDYMKSRGFNKSFCDEHEIGFDRHRKRVVFPIRDANDDLVAFNGRSLLSKEKIDSINKKRQAEDKGPYPRYRIYNKAPRRFLLGNSVYTTRNKDSVIVVEASMDYLALRKYGYENVVCIYGSHVSNYQWSLIKHFKSIYAFFDNDSAGADGAIKLIKEAKKNPDGPRILLPQYNEDDKDFDEMTKARAVELVETAKTYDSLTKKRIPKMM